MCLLWHKERVESAASRASTSRCGGATRWGSACGAASCSGPLHARYELTPREAQVAGMLLQRMTNREIAATLGISSHTARHHTGNILLKTKVNSRRALRRVPASEL